ncbi:MAG: TfoX/Sxy family protein [Candidatus Limnocylindrales bacterium]
MAYDERLAGRIRTLVHDEPGLTEQRMFGGLAFLVGGHMAVAARGGGGLMVHVDPAQTDAILATTSARRAEMRGRTMDGWLIVASQDLMDDDALAHWVALGTAQARSLPPKA